jgi:serine/threonine-protein kinase HipA
MTTSNSYREAYVWVWLPGEVTPVVAGRLEALGSTLVFNYGKSYLERDNKISLFTPELPLKAGRIEPLTGLTIAGCIRDAAPDAWGRRVLINRKFGHKGSTIKVAQLDELTYLLESGSDRIGALDFQLSPTNYTPRETQNVSLDELMHSADLVEKGLMLTPELAMALQHGTAIGGARPKALISSENKKYIGKFSSTTDIYSVVKAEFMAMRLAQLCGMNVAHVELKKSMGKDVLLIERFDRVLSKKGWQRKGMVSALTLFKLDEMMARYASYQELTEIVRHHFEEASKTLRELYQRMVFNILVGNTDDHARNHAAFWNGRFLSLTPAYDICPQARTGNEATQAMLIHGENRMSQLKVCLDVAPHFLLTAGEAIKLMQRQIEMIVANWNSVCSSAELSDIDRKFFQSRQFLNPFVFEELPPEAYSLNEAAQQFWS